MRYPRSVKTGRTNDEVLAGADAIWDCNAPAETAAIDLAAPRSRRCPNSSRRWRPLAVDKPFSDDDWLFELKLDGYRIEAVVDGPRVKLWTRNKQDAARYFPDLAARARPGSTPRTPSSTARSSRSTRTACRPSACSRTAPAWAASAARRRAGKPKRSTKSRKRDFMAPVVYYVFDLIYHDGRC